MMADPLLSALAAAVPDHPVRRVVIGLNWTLVQADGGCGLAHTPPRGTTGCRPLADAGDLCRRSMRDLAGGLGSDNPVEVAVAIAAINAACPVPTDAGEGNGLDLFAGSPARTIVVGRFPGITARLPGCKVVERIPAPGEYGEEEAAALLHGADALVITASALANGGVSRYLAMAARHPGLTIALVGPTTPLSTALLDAGITVLAGLEVLDADAVARVVMEGGAVKAMGPFTRNRVLSRPA